MSSHPSQPGPIALASVGVCLASLLGVVVFALPRRQAETLVTAWPAPQIVAPDAPLDSRELAKLKEELGHKPFSGTVFEAETQGPQELRLAEAQFHIVDPRSALLEAAHLLDEAAYVLEQVALFDRAASLREEAGKFRGEARRQQQVAQPAAPPSPDAAVENYPGPAPPR